jgi:hypothetical protein
MYFPDLPPAARTVEPAEPRPVARETCPRCGSGDVVHVVIGGPASADDVGSGSDRVRWAGCVHPGHDRECRACGSRWLEAAGGR